MDVQPLVVTYSIEDRYIMHYSALASRLCIDTFQKFGRLAIGNGGPLSQKYLLYSFVVPLC